MSTFFIPRTEKKRKWMVHSFRLSFVRTRISLGGSVKQFGDYFVSEELMAGTTETDIKE